MTTGSNLKIRGSVYYARQVVPVDLRQHFPSRELVKSLNTKDRRTANARKLAVLTEWQDTFADLRSRREISEADFAQATWQHYSDELHLDDVVRLAPNDVAPKSDIVRQHHIRALREHLGRGETVLVH